MTAGHRQLQPSTWGGSGREIHFLGGLMGFITALGTGDNDRVEAGKAAVARTSSSLPAGSPLPQPTHCLSVCHSSFLCWIPPCGSSTVHREHPTRGPASHAGKNHNWKIIATQMRILSRSRQLCVPHPTQSPCRSPELKKWAAALRRKAGLPNGSWNWFPPLL